MIQSKFSIFEAKIKKKKRKSRFKFPGDSLSSPRCADSTDTFDSLLPLVSIIYLSLQVLLTTSNVHIELIKFLLVRQY